MLLSFTACSGAVLIVVTIYRRKFIYDGRRRFHPGARAIGEAS